MISIIMPTYNRAYIIQQAIDSVLGQTYQDWELIIVDDGSTDDTETVVKGNADERIRYIKYTPNQGANHARNVGLKVARGDCLTFLDTDVIWKKRFLEARVTVLNQKDVDFVWGRVARFPLNRERVIILPNKTREELNNSLTLLSMQMLGGTIDTNVVCMKRKIYDNLGGFDEALMRLQEQEFFLRIMLKGCYKFIFTGDTLVKSYIKADSISQKPERIWKAFTYTVKKYVNEYRKNECLRDAWQLLLHLDGANKEAIRDFSTVLSDEEHILFELDMIELLEQRRIQIELNEKRIKEKMKMDWHFPKEKIPNGSRIIIYGAGDVGMSFMKQIAENHWCSVVLWVDKDYKKKRCKAIQAPQDIHNCVFDYIVISIANEQKRSEVENFLQSMGIQPKQIVTLET